MSDSEKWFAGWMENRRFEEASPDLAERIIQKSMGLRQQTVVSLGAWLKSCFAEFMLPKPSYVMAAVLAVGFVTGFASLTGVTNAPLDNDTMTQASLYEEGISE